MEKQNIEITIDGLKTTAKYERMHTNWKDETKLRTTICSSKNTDGDKFNIKIGIVVSILKTLGYSRRIISKISDILLEEDIRKSK